jgi:SAM-dependent methyltransferase
MLYFARRTKRNISVTAQIYIEPATRHNFDEAAYILANPDVASAVVSGQVKSAWWHFDNVGHAEGRTLMHRKEVMAEKDRKIERIRRELLMPDMDLGNHECGAINCLSDAAVEQGGVVEVAAVSSNEYDNVPLHFIENNSSAWVLDAGAGLRKIYYTNVVNFEIVAYDTTDVLGIGEKLPFRDNIFDFVHSNAVLEHVKNPFECARELYRVLKPGGELFCAVPFLQPYHGYPDHYYNMTASGVRNLFPQSLHIEEQYVPPYYAPLFVASWFLGSWANGLSESTKEELMNMRVREFLQPALSDLARPICTELSTAKVFELASGTVLRGRKI